MDLEVFGESGCLLVRDRVVAHELGVSNVDSSVAIHVDEDIRRDAVEHEDPHGHHDLVDDRVEIARACRPPNR